MVRNVCLGGDAATCVSNKPFPITRHLSMGFAAVSFSPSFELKGDASCGQCFELQFVPGGHTQGNYGGADPRLVGKRMVVQVTNTGNDVSGYDSFDIQIPGAGQGEFKDGCAVQFQGYRSGDFDCDRSYGGCQSIAGCNRLPPALQEGCRWRYQWFHWLSQSGKTDNPFINFRRVRCPRELVQITGTEPADDHNYPEVQIH